MSQHKHKASHPRIKQYFCSRPEQIFLAVPTKKCKPEQQWMHKRFFRFCCAGSTAFKC